ncbi:methyltransferase domain-containing protein [Streptomyces sp. SPB162]|uniref:methyltransferase domain-containing protein n=1 Tax=Streptomyces sp. SPB162 TaxID=2940560 RepID=UPI00240773DE|nr:methyltransferase domain-containing protein [Streptomyces sp. SPB162]MDF9817209.1 SAM-dependent methyltransferase [Streptomyces sp. SPB162]
MQEPVDALIGRLVLLHLDDPAAAVRAMARHVRPGGIVTFQERTIPRAQAVPPVQLFDQCRDWLRAGISAGGRDPDLGERLCTVLTDAGLVQPAAAVAIPAGGGHTPVVAHVEATVRSLLPLINKCGTATRRDINIDTLAERLALATTQTGAMLYLPELVASWGTTRPD